MGCISGLCRQRWRRKDDFRGRERVDTLLGVHSTSRFELALVEPPRSAPPNSGSKNTRAPSQVWPRGVSHSPQWPASSPAGSLDTSDGLSAEPIISTNVKWSFERIGGAHASAMRLRQCEDGEAACLHPLRELRAGCWYSRRAWPAARWLRRGPCSWTPTTDRAATCGRSGQADASLANRRERHANRQKPFHFWAIGGTSARLGCSWSRKRSFDSYP